MTSRLHGHHCSIVMSAQLAEMVGQASHPYFTMGWSEIKRERERGKRERGIAKALYSILDKLPSLWYNMLQLCVISPVGRDGRPPAQIPSRFAPRRERKESIICDVFHTSIQDTKKSARVESHHRTGQTYE